MSDTYEPEYQPDDLISTVRAGRVAGVHQRTIITWIRTQGLEAIKRPGAKGRYLIKYQDLVDFAFRRYERGQS